MFARIADAVGMKTLIDAIYAALARKASWEEAAAAIRHVVLSDPVAALNPVTFARPLLLWATLLAISTWLRHRDGGSRRFPAPASSETRVVLRHSCGCRRCAPSGKIRVSSRSSCDWGSWSTGNSGGRPDGYELLERTLAS